MSWLRSQTRRMFHPYPFSGVELDESLYPSDDRLLATEFMQLPSKKQWPYYYIEIKHPRSFDDVYVCIVAHLITSRRLTVVIEEPERKGL